MDNENICYRDERPLPTEQILQLYHANGWLSATKPETLCQALENSDSVITAWHHDKLVGLGNAITDGALVVYYPHLLVLPEYHRRGIGRRIMELMQQRYSQFYQQVLIAEPGSTQFYQSMGFKRVGQAEPMEIYRGAFC